MDEALMSLLLGYAPLTALVGDRVHWLVQPRSASGFPYVNLQVISDPRSYHMKGESGLRRARVQADVWAETKAAAKDVKGALGDLLSGYRGAQSGVNFQGIFMGGGRDLTDQATGADPQLFRISVDFDISWNMEI